MPLQRLPDIKIPYPTEGVIRSAQLNDTVSPENSAQLAVNLNFDCVGAIQTRPGVQQLYDNAPGAIVTFGTLNIQGGVKRLFTQVGLQIYAWITNTWTSVRTGTTTNKARFSQWLNRIYMVNGVDELQVSSGSTFSAEAGFVPSGPSMPVGDYIQAGFDGRVWVASKLSDAIYYSNIVQFTPPSTYAITYTATNYIQTLSSQNGESITGLFMVPRALLVFKQNHIWRIYNASNVDPFPAYNVGTYSQESIVQAKDGIYFHHSSGFYKFAYDGQPIEISKRINDFVKAIPRSAYDDVVGIYDGYDAIKWSVGEITVEGVTYNNCQMRYTISTQIWTIYDYADNDITALINFDDGTEIYQVVGTAQAKVGQLDTGTDDFGDPIFFDFIDRWRSFTNMYANVKAIDGAMVSSVNGAGVKLQVQLNKQQNGENVWIDLGGLESSYASLFPSASSEDFNVCRLRLNGTTSGTPIIIDGIELLAIIDKGYDKN